MFTYFSYICPNFSDVIFNRWHFRLKNVYILFYANSMQFFVRSEKVKRCSSDLLIISVIYATLHKALRIYRMSRRTRYHGLTQIQSYTWGAALILIRGVRCCLRCRTLSCFTYRAYLSVLNVFFGINLCIDIFI